MNDFHKGVILSLSRKALTGVSVLLVKSGWITDDQSTQLILEIAGYAGLGLSVLFSWLSQQAAQRVKLSALTPGIATLDEAKALSKAPSAPPVSTPNNVTPLAPAVADVRAAQGASSSGGGSRLGLFLIPLLLALGAGSACGKSAPVLVGESAIVASKFIQTASDAVMPLVPQPLSRDRALAIQDNLDRANTEIKRLIPVLRAIDAAQKAGDPAAPQIEEAIRMVQNIGTSLNLSVQGVPIAEAAARLLEVVNNARGALATIQATLDALKHRQSGDLGPGIRRLEDLMGPVPVFTN